jgi:hypothetical protein
MRINRIAWYRSIASARRSSIRTFFLSVCALGIAAVASAHQPRFITFDVPGAGKAPFQGTGCWFGACYVVINDWGEISGYYLDANNVFHGYIRSPEGKFTSFDAPGADMSPQPDPFETAGTFPKGMNDAGAITGVYTDASGGVHGFLRSPEGAFTTFDAPGGLVGSPPVTIPIAINVEGAIVGYYFDQNFVYQSFLRHPDGSFETWTNPGQCEISISAGCLGSGAFSINAFGTIAGGYQDNSGNFVTHGFIRTAHGKLMHYSDPAAGAGPYQGTNCPGCQRIVNLFGEIAGFYIDPENVVHGFVRSPLGTFTNFDIPQAAPQDPSNVVDWLLGFNDWGAITGDYTDANGVYHGFLRGPDGTITSFDAPGADLTPGDNNGTYPNSINDAGVITGTYQDSNNVFHGFILLPEGQ